MTNGIEIDVDVDGQDVAKFWVDENGRLKVRVYVIGLITLGITVWRILIASGVL